MFASVIAPESSDVKVFGKNIDACRLFHFGGRLCCAVLCCDAQYCQLLPAHPDFFRDHFRHELHCRWLNLYAIGLACVRGTQLARHA